MDTYTVSVRNQFQTAKDLYQVTRHLDFERTCWVWRGPSRQEVPVYQTDEVSLFPQVLLFEIAYDREFTDVKDVIPHCENPMCCNPLHVEVVGKFNQLDFGKYNTKKMTPFDVLNLRREYQTGRYTMRQLSMKYNLSSGNVSDIIHGKKHGSHDTPNPITAHSIPMGNDVHEKHL